MGKRKTIIDDPNEIHQPLKLTFTGNREWVFSDQDTSDEVYELFEEALDHIEEYEYVSARKKLMKLLELNPDHIDALHHLAIIEKKRGNLELSKELWKRGVEVGRTVIPKRFKRGSSRIPWSNLDNRPFLRCLHGHAFALIDEGRVDEAIQAFQELIDYNPDDNLGARDNLISMLIEKDRLGEAFELSKKYDDDSGPCIMYGRALANFLKGNIEDAERSLSDAIRYTPKAAEEILKKKHQKPEEWMPGYITVGGWDQAFYYWEMQGKYWTPEAKEWLRRRYPGSEQYEGAYFPESSLSYKDGLKSEEEFNKIFDVASGLCYKQKKKRNRCIDKLAEIGVKAIGPILYLVECDAAHDDEDPEDYDRFKEACLEAMRRIGHPALSILEKYALEEDVHGLVNVFAQEAIFEVLGLDEEERKEICHHREAIIHDEGGETFYTCAICEKVMTEEEWNK